MRHNLSSDFNFFVGHNIKIWRELKSLKQSYVATRLGISKATLSNIENGKIDITISRAKKISELFGITFEDLLVDPFNKISSNRNFQQKLDG